MAASEALGMQTGSAENISAKTNHMLHIFKNLYSQTECKGRLSWRARASFQAEWLLGEGIIQMFSWHICVSSLILEEKAGRPILVPRAASVPGGKSTWLSWLSRVSQFWEFHPGLDSCSRLMAATSTWKEQRHHGWSLAVTSKNCNLLPNGSWALPSRTMLDKERWFSSFVQNFSMISKNRLVCN